MRHSLHRLSENRQRGGESAVVTVRGRYRESSVWWSSHHGGDVAKALQVLHYTALVCGLHTSKAPRGGAGLPLQVRGQLVELSACQANHCALLLLLLLCDDAHPATDRQGCPFVVTLKQTNNKKKKDYL